MKKLNRLFMIGALGLIGLLSSCSSDDEILVDPTSEFDVVLEFSNTSGDVTEPVNVVPTQGIVKARVMVTSTSNMRRLYITRNVGGAGDVPYTPADLSNKVTKPDGSIDVETDPKSLDYSLNLDVPSSITAGTVVYKFWATSGKGDYRDVENSFVAGVGQIELVYGGSNPAAPVKSYSAKILAAPLADGTSNTFISLLDGKLYKIKDGAEYSALWDFGYYYGASGVSAGQKSSLASTSKYEASFGFVDVDGIAGTTELNNCFFQLSTKTIAEFNAVTVSGDLSFVTSSGIEKINNLAVDDVVEFVDNYGKKGLIKVTEIKGTFNSTDYIKIDIKVQP